MSNPSQQKYQDKPHILVVDDDKRICDLISRYLREQGFIVITANNALEARDKMSGYDLDGMVLDVMMPGETGMELTSEMRSKGISLPVLLLTALGEVDDRIKGFQLGADDYLTKPFEPQELVLRLKAILKRTQKPKSSQTIFSIGDWMFDPRHDELEQEEKTILLTSVEAGLLRALCQSINEVVSREDLARRCKMNAGERTIDVQVTRLRKKIELDSKKPRYLQTIRGKGYILRAKES